MKPPDSPSPLAWGILTTGHIARKFADALTHSKLGRAVAVGSRTREAAEKFAVARGDPTLRTYGDYQAVIDDPAVRAVYVAGPHPHHLEWALRAIAADKHVLCEKPLAMNRAEAERMIAAARERGVLLMEAFMYRCAPQTVKILELLRGGALGRVGAVQAAFSFSKSFDARHRLWARELGGGAILDVGCYTMSFARLVAGTLQGKAFAEPIQLHGVAELHPETRTDVHAAAVAKFPGGLLARLTCGIGLSQETSARLFGSDGWLDIPAPWQPAREGGTSSLWLHRADAKKAEEIVVKTDRPLFTYETDAFARAVNAGQREMPEMSFADTLGNAAALDRWLVTAGVSY
jgi:predicted dehydrogenase